MKSITFERKTLIQKDWYGLDSIQGILHFIDQYKNNCCLSFEQSSETNYAHVYFHLRQLEREGYAVLDLVPMEGRPEFMRLRSAALTISGRKLLDELTAKSRIGAMKKRLVDIVWIVGVSVVTTLISLWIKGK